MRLPSPPSLPPIRFPFSLWTNLVSRGIFGLWRSSKPQDGSRGRGRTVGRSPVAEGRKGAPMSPHHSPNPRRLGRVWLSLSKVALRERRPPRPRPLLSVCFGPAAPDSVSIGRASRGVSQSERERERDGFSGVSWAFLQNEGPDQSDTTTKTATATSEVE